MTSAFRLPQEHSAVPVTHSPDWLRAGEWLFLLFVLAISSYALSLQPQIQSLSWYLAYLAALSLFVLRYGAFLGSVWIALPLLLWPLLAGLSYTWSDAPTQSLRSAVQLTMTVLISLYLGARFNLSQLTRALFVVLAVAGLLSLVAILANMGFAFDRNGIARGLFPHKNVLGGRMVLLAVCCLLLFAVGWHRLLTIVFALLALVLIGLSQSGTAILMILGLCGLAPVVLTRHAAAPLRLIGYLLALLTISVIAWAFLAFDRDPVDLVLEALGKERTLTGRSVLWDFALAQIDVRPFFGGGFDAFWNSGDASQGRYVQYVLGSAVTNFHNSYLDITVQLGLSGLAVTALFLLAFAWRALALTRHDRGAPATLPLLFLAFVVVYSVSEYALYRQHDLIQILLGAFYVSAALALTKPEVSLRQTSPSSFATT